MDDTPRFKILALDESEFWDEKILSFASRLIGVYLVDVNRYVNAAEITSSYEAIFLGTEFTNDHLREWRREWLHDQIAEVDARSEHVYYFHVHSISDDEFTDDYGDVSEEWVELLEEHEGDRDAAYEELLEEVLEYYRGNSPDIGEWT